ncbi:semaphorin-4C-like [Sinocyclocheilus grahami]|uniref:semaphorin-4C-like n=1 Tax=Sinocyclocheilus grahami TaxID=75366 RepID=UPI0007ACDA62|nr:PREDICTED: semaphorin-4C-like [Sinocyclocheilus grahami]
MRFWTRCYALTRQSRCVHLEPRCPIRTLASRLIRTLASRPIRTLASRPIRSCTPWSGEMWCAKVLLVMCVIGFEKGICVNWNPVPRKTVKYNDVHDSMARFRAVGVWNYTMLTLAEHERVLYVGAREHIFALDPNDISRQLRPQIEWSAPVEKKRECTAKGKNNQTECFNYIRFLQSYNHTHLYTCGTYAFQPKCTYINADHFTLDSAALEDGKGKCPYDPAKGHTGLIVDKELYSATLNNFLGTEPVILRNLGQQHYSMKSEYLPAWLNEPNFVGSALVRESRSSKDGDDDKIYFFFSERAVELDCDSDLTVARVARVCKALTVCRSADGWLQRVVILGSEAHVIEEIQLFDRQQPVDSLTISHSKKYLYIGSRSEVLQLPLANCSRYHSQPDCLLSRDPYCAWDSEGRACVRIDLHRGSTSTLSQDLMLERFSRGKAKFEKPFSIPSPDHSRLRNVTVVVGSDLVLPCHLVSNLAQPFWELNERELALVEGGAPGPRFDQALRSLVIPQAGPLQAGRYICYSEEQGVKFQTERYQVAVVASAPVFMEARAPDGSMGLFWVLVITLGAACLLLLIASLYLRRRLKLALGKGAEMKPLESTLVYPITLPKEPPSRPSFVPSKMANDDDRFWETGANYYYSDGSLKIVPGHALCSTGSSASPSAIPGQPIHSPSRLSLTNIRSSNANGYIRLNLSSAGEERSGIGAAGMGIGIGGRDSDYSSPFKEELRKTLQQRSVLPDANPEESSV